jgi:hypothetical protein
LEDGEVCVVVGCSEADDLILNGDCDFGWSMFGEFENVESVDEFEEG